MAAIKKALKAGEITTADLAYMLAISPHYVSKLADAGVFKRGRTHGVWPMADSVRGYVEHVRTQKNSETMEAAKLRERNAKARLAESQADEKEGKLLPVDVVASANAAVLSAFVTRLCNFGDGIANVCHNQPADFISERVNGALRSALREVAKLPHISEDEKKKALQPLVSQS